MSSAATFFLWPDQAVYLGPGFETDNHAHYAFQLCLALEGVLEIRTESERAWTRTRVGAAPSLRPHQLKGGTPRIALLYFDPHSETARRLVAAASSQSWLSFETAPAQIPRAPQLSNNPELDCGRLRAWMQDCVQALAPGTPVRSRTEDARITLALRLLLAETPENPLSLASLAEQVGLSAGRFRHLFAETTGASFTAYRLWSRLHRAVTIATEERDLTFAAHAAGFADLAHFSRAFKRSFGVAPGDFFARRSLVSGYACQAGTEPAQGAPGPSRWLRQPDP